LQPLLFLTVFLAVLAALAVARWYSRQQAKRDMLIAEYVARAQKWLEQGFPPSVAIQLARLEYEATVLNDEKAAEQWARMMVAPVTREVVAAWSKEWEAFEKDRKVTDSPETRALWKQIQQRRKELEHGSEHEGEEEAT